LANLFKETLGILKISLVAHNRADRPDFTGECSGSCTAGSTIVQMMGQPLCCYGPACPKQTTDDYENEVVPHHCFPEHVALEL